MHNASKKNIESIVNVDPFNFQQLQLYVFYFKFISTFLHVLQIVPSLIEVCAVFNYDARCLGIIFLIEYRTASTANSDVSLC